MLVPSDDCKILNTNFELFNFSLGMSIIQNLEKGFLQHYEHVYLMEEMKQQFKTAEEGINFLKKQLYALKRKELKKEEPTPKVHNWNGWDTIANIDWQEIKRDYGHEVTLQLFSGLTTCTTENAVAQTLANMGMNDLSRHLGLVK